MRLTEKELQQKIEECNGDMFFAYGYVKQLEMLKEEEKRKSHEKEKEKSKKLHGD